MKGLEELFLHELKDIYDAEQRLVVATGKMAKQSTDPEIRQAFREHAEETEGQVERLRQVFKVLGKRPQKETCPGMAGIIKEHDAVVKELEPESHVLDLINLSSAQKVEKYEITAYQGLIHLAQTIGHDKEVVDLLNENLMEEQAALELVQSLHEDYDVEAAAEVEPDEAPRKSGRKSSKARGRSQTVAAGGRGGSSRGGNKRKSKSR